MCMRTTLDLEKPVLEALKKVDEREGTTMSRLASRLLAEALVRQSSASVPPPEFRWIAAPMGARLGLSDKEALFRVLDEQ